MGLFFPRFWRRTVSWLIFLGLLFSGRPCPSVLAEGPSGLKYDGLWVLAFNLRVSPFSAKNSLALRQAIAGAVDRSALARDIFGASLVPNGVIPEGLPGYDEKSPGYPYQPGRSREIIKNLPGSAKNNLVLLHTDGVKTIQAAQAIKNNLQEVGLAIELKMVALEDFDSSDLYLQQIEKDRAGMFLLGFKADTPDDPLTLLRPVFGTKGRANLTGYSDQKVDSLLDAAAALTDRAEIARLLASANQLIVDDLPVLPLFYIRRLEPEVLFDKEP